MDIADDGLVERYEQLRHVALGATEHADGFGHGPGVLTSRGMTAWMRACRPGRTADTNLPAAPASGPARDALTGEVIAVLAQMALAHV